MNQQKGGRTEREDTVTTTVTDTRVTKRQTDRHRWGQGCRLRRKERRNREQSSKIRRNVTLQ